MITFFKKVFGVYKYEKAIEELKELNRGYQEELRQLQNTRFDHYTTLPVPIGEGLKSFDRFLADLYNDNRFAFYLLTLENEMVVKFANGKGGEEYFRGGLQTISKIKHDTLQANNAIMVEELKTHG